MQDQVCHKGNREIEMKRRLSPIFGVRRLSFNSNFVNILKSIHFKSMKLPNTEELISPKDATGKLLNNLK